MKRRIRIAALMLTTAMLFAVTALANSAQTFWEGTDAVGAIVVDENSPIVVEKEDLTFDLQTFPGLDNAGDGDLSAYTGSVTAEYTFYNPSDYTVTAKLLFPFGGTPYYGVRLDYNDGNSLADALLEKYGVRVNGQQIGAKLRHTYADYFHQFELEEDLARLSDGYAEDDFYSPELNVTKYTYRIYGFTDSANASETVCVLLNVDPEKTSVYLEDCSGMKTVEEGILAEVSCSQGAWNDDGGRNFDLYVIGEPLETMPEWTVYASGSEEEPMDASFEILSTETMSFLEFALLERDGGSEVSESDWYNAFVFLLNQCDTGHGLVDTSYGAEFDQSFQRWYEYEITLEPGERIVNAVTAPMYPSVQTDYEPDVFIYTYLVSPAKTWAEFGELNIYINTPSYLTESSLEGFEKTESGYALHLDGLPEGELEFLLCSEEDPKRDQGDLGYGLTIVLLLILRFLKYAAIPGLVIAGVALAIRAKKRKKKDE